MIRFDNETEYSIININVISMPETKEKLITTRRRDKIAQNNFE